MKDSTGRSRRTSKGDNTRHCSLISLAWGAKRGAVVVMKAKQWPPFTTQVPATVSTVCLSHNPILSTPCDLVLCLVVAAVVCVHLFFKWVTASFFFLFSPPLVCHIIPFFSPHAILFFAWWSRQSCVLTFLFQWETAFFFFFSFFFFLVTSPLLFLLLFFRLLSHAGTQQSFFVM